MLSRQTREGIDALKRALLHLAGVCDGAHQRDGQGFDGRDAGSSFVRSAVAWAQGQGKMGYKGQLIALKTCQKYHKQLVRAGISLPSSLPELEQIVAADAAASEGGSAMTSAGSFPARETSSSPRAREQVSSGPLFSRASPADDPFDDVPHPADTMTCPPSFDDDPDDPELIVPSEIAPAADPVQPISQPTSQPPVPAQKSYTRPDAFGASARPSTPGQMTLARANQLEFIGRVYRIFYGPNDKGWTIAQVEVVKALSSGLQGYPELKVVGTMASAKIGGEFKFIGEWETNSYKNKRTNQMVTERQFKVAICIEHIPENRAGIIGWLSTIQGIGQVLAGRIVDHFGEAQCLQILNETPERVAEVSGIGGDKAADVVKKIADRTKYQELIVWLSSLGVSHTMIDKIREHFEALGRNPMQEITQNPYSLMAIHGIGFKKADIIARALSIPHDSAFRIAAGLLHTLDEKCQERGHCFLPREDLIMSTRDLLMVDHNGTLFEVDARTLARHLQELVNREEIVDEAGGVWPKHLYTAEVEIAGTIARMLAEEDTVDSDSIIPLIEDWQSLTGFRLHEIQEHAVLTALTRRVMILTGGPGTGKTTTTRAIVDLLWKMKIPVALCAPTGRASRRMAQATGREAQTIHRMIGLAQNAEGGRRRDGQWLDARAVVVDEASMVDAPLMRALIRAINPKARLIIVGDIDQLPSVGPGSVLRDLIASEAVPTVRLTEIFRQQGGQQNMIVAGAHAINSGLMPELEPYAGKASLEPGRMVWIETRRGNASAIPDEICRVVRDLQDRLQDDGREDDPFEVSQVLIPQRTTDAGVKAVNNRLQDTFNADGVPVKDGYWIRVGDKVMQTVNNYDLDGGGGVFNGDVGYVTDVVPSAKQVIISYEGRPVPYSFAQLDEVVLAYSTTIHKSQGSEYQVVIVVACDSHIRMLCRQLLYTGITRGKKTVVIIGDKRAIEKAVSDATIARRYTLLAERVRRAVQQLAQIDATPTGDERPDERDDGDLDEDDVFAVEGPGADDPDTDIPW